MQATFFLLHLELAIFLIIFLIQIASTKMQLDILLYTYNWEKFEFVFQKGRVEVMDFS